jgi:general stress protein 26
MKSELKRLYDLIKEIEIAMMTTRRPDDHLESRAMANQKVAAGADLWFVTTAGTARVRDLESDPQGQPGVLQGPHARVDLGVGNRQGVT